jgi:uncharacterized protein YjbI with pentapeptide repeats
LDGAVLQGTNLDGAKLAGATITQEQIDQACANEDTRLPATYHLPKHCDRDTNGNVLLDANGLPNRK